MPSPLGRGDRLQWERLLPLPALLMLGHLLQGGRLLEICNLGRLQLQLELICNKRNKFGIRGFSFGKSSRDTRPWVCTYRTFDKVEFCFVEDYLEKVKT